MKIGYGKIGRTIQLDPRKWGPVGGDNEPRYLLEKLARARPDDEWRIIGRNSGQDPRELELPPNVTNAWVGRNAPFMAERDGGINAEGVWDGTRPRDNSLQVAYAQTLHSLTWDMFADLDAVVLWLGQHGTSNMPIPDTKTGKLTSPYTFALNYGAHLILGLNRWTDEDETRDVTWLIADNRNYLKCRDLKWPPRRHIIGQYSFVRSQKHERYGDPRAPQECGYVGDWHRAAHAVWVVQQPYLYEQLEVVGIPEHWEPTRDFAERVPFGLLINEARGYVKLNRKDIVRDWVLPLQPDFIVGKWSDESRRALGIDPAPILHSDIPEVLGSAKCTFTTPSSGSGWATTKPWECFALGVVCFFHPMYDFQGHIIPTRRQLSMGEVQDDELVTLARWLRPRTPAELEKGVAAVSSSRETFDWLVAAQRRVWEKARYRQQAVQAILHRLP